MTAAFVIKYGGAAMEDEDPYPLRYGRHRSDEIRRHPTHYRSRWRSTNY